MNTLTVDYTFNPSSQRYEAQWELDGFIFNTAASDFGELQDEVLDSIDEHGGDVKGVAFFNVDGEK